MYSLWSEQPDVWWGHLCIFEVVDDMYEIIDARNHCTDL